jgi:hypothetical protein
VSVEAGVSKTAKVRSRPKGPLSVKLRTYINRCSCGRILTRRDGQTVHCLACGAEWDGVMLRLPSGLPPPRGDKGEPNVSS